MQEAEATEEQLQQVRERRRRRRLTWSWWRVADSDELIGSNSFSSRLPQYLITAMFTGAAREGESWLFGSVGITRTSTTHGWLWFCGCLPLTHTHHTPHAHHTHITPPHRHTATPPPDLTTDHTSPSHRRWGGATTGVTRKTGKARIGEPWRAAAALV